MATTAQTQDTTNSANATKSPLGNSELVNKATRFAKERPWATATLAGVVGMALLNTLRGRR